MTVQQLIDYVMAMPVQTLGLYCVYAIGAYFAFAIFLGFVTALLEYR